MKIKFTHAVHFLGVDYKKGINEIPDQVLELPVFLNMVKLGSALDVEEAQYIAPLTPLQRSKNLANKLAEMQKEKLAEVAKEHAKANPPTEEGSLPSEDGEDDFGGDEASDEEEKPKHKSKSKKK